MIERYMRFSCISKYINSPSPRDDGTLHDENYLLATQARMGSDLHVVKVPSGSRGVGSRVFVPSVCSVLGLGKYLCRTQSEKCRSRMVSYMCYRLYRCTVSGMDVSIFWRMCRRTYLGAQNGCIEWKDWHQLPNTRPNTRLKVYDHEFGHGKTLSHMNCIFNRLHVVRNMYHAR